MKSKEKVDELKKALKVEKKLIAQKDDELQVALPQTVEARDKVITQFQEYEHYSDPLFTQYFKGFELLFRWMLKHQGEAINLSALDFEVMDTEMIADEAKEKERRAAEEVASVLAEVEVENAVVGAEIVAAKGGEATNQGVDGQTITAPSNHPSEQDQVFFFFFQSHEQWMPPVLRLLFPNSDCLHVLRLILLENNDCPKAYLVQKQWLPLCLRPLYFVLCLLS